jgi:hypothetical protein
LIRAEVALCGWRVSLAKFVTGRRVSFVERRHAQAPRGQQVVGVSLVAAWRRQADRRVEYALRLAGGAGHDRHLSAQRSAQHGDAPGARAAPSARERHDLVCLVANP